MVVQASEFQVRLINPMSRARGVTPNRHALPNPLSNSESLKQWEQGLMKGRISELFKTERGLQGHVEQIQNELNRLSISKLSEIECPGDYFTLLQQVDFRIRKALTSAAAAAAFKLPRQHLITSPINNWTIKL